MQNAEAVLVKLGDDRLGDLDEPLADLDDLNLELTSYQEAPGVSRRVFYFWAA